MFFLQKNFFFTKIIHWQQIFVPHANLNEDACIIFVFTYEREHQIVINKHVGNSFLENTEEKIWIDIELRRVLYA